MSPGSAIPPAACRKSKVTVKVKFTLEQATKAQSWNSTLPSTSALDEDGWSTPLPGRFTTGKEAVPIVQEAGWTPRPVRTSAENPPPRSLDRPARSEWLYRLRYAGPPAARIRLHTNATRNITS